MSPKANLAIANKKELAGARVRVRASLGRTPFNLIATGFFGYLLFGNTYNERFLMVIPLGISLIIFAGDLENIWRNIRKLIVVSASDPLTRIRNLGIGQGASAVGMDIGIVAVTIWIYICNKMCGLVLIIISYLFTGFAIMMFFGNTIAIALYAICLMKAIKEGRFHEINDLRHANREYQVSLIFCMATLIVLGILHISFPAQRFTISFLFLGISIIILLLCLISSARLLRTCSKKRVL